MTITYFQISYKNKVPACNLKNCFKIFLMKFDVATFQISFQSVDIYKFSEVEDIVTDGDRYIALSGIMGNQVSISSTFYDQF